VLNYVNYVKKKLA